MGSDRSPDRFSWERALLASDEFSATEQHVLLVLATHFGKRPATPGTRRLARLAHRNRETVMAALRHAEEAGWLVRGRRGRDGGGYVSTYQPLVPGDGPSSGTTENGPSLGTASAENGPSSGTASHEVLCKVWAPYDSGPLHEGSAPDELSLVMARWRC